VPRTYGITNVAPWASAPAVGNAGDTYWNTANKTLYASDGTAWNAVGAAPAVQNMTGQATYVIGNAAWSAPITGWTVPSPALIGPVSAGQVTVLASLAGAWLWINALIGWAGITTGQYRRSVEVCVNGVEIARNDGASSLTNIPFSSEINTVYQAVGGETIDVRVFQNSGGNLALQPPSANAGHLFQIARFS
jgi:hypothetical protein